MKKSKINYNNSDIKAEAHFLGQIEGVSNLVEGDGLFAEVLFETGKGWMSLGSTTTLQTQTGYTDMGDFISFCHPFDLHYAVNNVFGWPKIVCRLWKLDESNKIDLLAYGCDFLPNTEGYHMIEFKTWILQGSLVQETLGFFLNTKPRMNVSDPISSNLDKRQFVKSKPGPCVHVSCEVVFKNFSILGITGQQGF